MTIYKFTHLHIYTFALCLVLLFTGCRPHGVLSSKQMRSVLYDLHRTDAILQAAGYNYGHDEDVAKYYQAVMDKHGVTQAQFDSSLVWYTNNPQLFDKIYPRVVKELEADRDAWQAQHDETQRLIGLELQEKWNREDSSESIQRKSLDAILYEGCYGLPVQYFLDSVRPSLSPDTPQVCVPYIIDKAELDSAEVDIVKVDSAEVDNVEVNRRELDRVKLNRLELNRAEVADSAK